MSGFIQTYTGRRFFPLAPTVETVDIDDIAHALSLINRFTGHTSRFYSVAQHSVLVAQQLPRDLQLQGLLHDAAEAYLADVASPIKALPEMAFFRTAEESLLATIFEAFRVHPVIHATVHEADRRMLFTEARDLMDCPDWIGEPYPFTITPWDPEMAEAMFLACFRLVTR